MNRFLLSVVMLVSAGVIPAQAQPVQWATGEINKAVVAGKIAQFVEMKTVRGAPYSAEATTEFVQTLGDGNRIVRRTVTRVFRDSEGRVRRENLRSDGTVESITITDPVSGKSATLDPEGRAVVTHSGQVVLPSGRGAGGRGDVIMMQEKFSATITRFDLAWADKRSKEPSDAQAKQDLGQQSFEGIAARGTRTTTTIPAGAIGNELPIRVVSEEWLSPELQVLVQTKHSDPRSGDTTYTLTGISRAEPAASLFEIPAGYTTRRPKGQ